MSIERRCDGCGTTASVDETKGWIRVLPLLGGWTYDFHDNQCCADNIARMASAADKALTDAASAAVAAPAVLP